MADKTRQIYTTLKNGGADVGSYDEFHNWFYAKGKQGYQNRKNVWDTMNAGGADVGKSYEEFRDWLKLAPASRQSGSPTPARSTENIAKKTTQNGGGHAMSPSERWGFLQSAQDLVDDSAYSLSRTQRAMDYAKRNTGLKVKPVKLGENSKVVEKEPIYNPVSGTAERYYMDSEGNEHATRAQADFTQRQIDKDKDLIGYLDKQAQESIDDAFQRQYDEAQRYKEEHPYLSAFSRALAAFGGRMSGGSGGNINQYTPAEAKAGLATIALNHKTRQMIDEGKRWGHTTVLGRTLRGVKAGLTDAGMYDFGLSDTQNAVALKEAADRYEQGKATADDEMLLAAASLSNETAAKYADALGGAYSAGKNLVGTIGFMAQIASNPASGIGKATAQKVARTVGQYAISKFGSRLAAKAVKALAKGAARVGMDAVEVGVVTGMYGPTKIVGDYAERKTGNVHANGDGTYTFEGKEYSSVKALAKAINAQNAEYLSEMWGAYLPGAGKIGGRIAKGVRKIGMGKLVDAFEHMSTSEWVNTWRRFTERTKWNGTFGEYGEEFLNNFYNAITNGDMTLDNAQGTGVFNRKVNLDTLESVGLMSGIMGAANAGGYKVAKYDARRAQKKSDIRARNVFGKDRWEEIKNIIDAADAKQLGNMMEEIGTGDYFTEDQKLAVLDYQYRTAYMNGFNAQSLKNKLEGQQDMTEDSYDAGYNISAPQEKNDAKINYDLQREKLARIYGEDSAILEHIDDDPMGFAKEMSAKGDNAHAEEVLEYANAKAAYEGMIKRVQDDIENNVAESDAITDSMTHEDGNLYPATMKTDDRKVYVISGYAQMLEDGSGVDHEKSSHDIIIKDAETGKIEFTTPDQILNVDTPQDASTVKREAAENIRQTIAQASADQIDGVLPFNSGDEYAILGTDNTQHTIQILTDQGDGTVQVVVDGNANTPMVMTKDSIQNGAKANSLARLQQAKEQQSDKDTAIARDIQDGNTGQVAGVDDVTGKGAVEQVQRAVNTETFDNKQDKDATETMPMIGEGEDAEPDFYHVVPARAHTYIYNEAGLNRKEGDAFVDANLKEAQKTLEKAKKGEPVMGTSIAKYRKEQAAYQQIVDDAQRAVDYWNGVKAEQDKVVAEESRMRAEQQAAETRQAVERRKAESIQQDGDARRSGEGSKIDASVSDRDYVLSDKKAENGERFYQDAKGNIDLADIPEDIFNKIGKPKAPFRLTPSMLKHVFDRHGKEMGLSQADDAIDFVLDVMDNFDHVRQGDKNAIIFSIENGRSRTGRRAVTVLLDSNSGEYYGIKTSGYERIEGLNKKPLLWEKGADETSATGVAPANVTTKRAQQGNGPTGSASNHSTGSASKDSKIFNPVQENENIFAKAERISREDEQRRAEAEKKENGPDVRRGKEEAVSEVPAMTETEYLASKGLDSPMTDYMLDKTRIPHGETARQRTKRNQKAEKAMNEHAAQKDAARKEYRDKIAKGELREPTKEETEQKRIDALIKTANGHEDNPSVQAARRVLEKRGIEWHEQKNEDVSTDRHGKVTQEESENFLSQRDFAEKGMLSALGQTKYKTLKEWEDKDVESYVDKYDDLIAGYTNYVESFAKDDKLQALYDKSSVREQKKIGENIEDADLDYHDILNTSPQRLLMQDRLTRKTKYAKGEFADGTIVTGEVVNQTPESLTISYRGTKYPISAKHVLEQSDEPIDSVLYRSGDEEYTNEERGIIEHAKSDGSYMKAPNGEPTNLDEKQWAQVRTKAFKDWFGDWEKVARIEKLKKSKPVKITGEEIEPSDDLKQYKKNALEYGKKLQGVYTNKDTGLSIQLQRGRKNGGINEVLQHNYKDIEHLQSVAAIPQIIENSIYIDSEDNNDLSKNPNVKEYQHFLCGLKIGGEDYTVHSLIAIDQKGNRYYDHKLTKIEKGSLLNSLNGLSNSVAGEQQAQIKGSFGTTPDTKSTTSNGKDSKLVSILQTNSSKVLDENGEPMVVYHGTQEDFYTFGLYDDTGVQNVFNEIPSHSFLLTPDEYAAGQYGETGAFFVNAKNILNATSKEKILDIIHDRWEDINNDGLETVNFDGPQDAVNELGYLIQEDGRLFAGDFSASELQENEIEEKWHSIQTAIENYAKDHDFDAYLFNDSARDEECISYGVFSPNQIKSATDNNGAFDAGSDDVRFRSDEVKAFAEAHHLEIDDVAAYEYAMSIGNNGAAHYALSTIRRKQRTSHRDMKLSEFGKMFSKIRKGLYEQFGDLNALDEKYRQNVFKERGLMEAAHRREEEERKKLREPIEALMSLTSEERDAEYMRALEAKDDNRMREVLQAEAEMKGYTTDVNYQGEGTWNAPANPGYKTAEERRAAVEEDIPDLNIDDLAHGYTNQPDDIFTNMRAYGNDNESGRESGKAITDAIRYIKSGKGMPKVTVYRAVPTSIKENSLRNGDWVTPSKAYAKMHGESRLEGDYRIIEQKVPADELWWDSNDIREWGFDNGKDYTYKNTENGRKLNDLVIRDDNGNVILPSQRFNDKMTDERFRTFGGNRGYVDYSKSVRAVEAEQRGLRNKSQMDKNFADKVNGLIDDGTKFSLKEIKTALKFIDADEWHHTSKMGNKTDYYSAETIADYLNSTSGRKRLRREMLNMAFRKKHKGEYWLDPLETEDGVVSVMEMGKGRTMKVPHDISKEDFAARLSDLKQGGNDTVLRSEVSENNQSSGRQGKMYDVAQDLVSKLGLTDSVTVMKNADGLTGEKAKAKGWFDTTTGKIVIVMGNHRNVQDVIQTILHEAVAHYGLRKLFGKHFDTFLDNVFKNADENVKKRITELAMRKYGGRFDVATEEYLAGLAENTDFEDVKNNGWWGRIKQLFLDMLHKIGFDGFDGISLSDNELRYILWRSYENLANDNRHRSILDVAKDIDMQNRLQVGNYAAEKEKKPSEKTLPSDDVSDTNTGNASEGSKKSEDTLFRDGSEPERTARDIYEEAVKDTGSATMLGALAHTIVSKDARERFKNKFSEAYFDYSRSIKQLQDAIEKATGAKLADYENVWWKLNAKSSIDAQEVNLAMFRYIAPLAEHVGKMVKGVELDGHELTQDDVEVYMNAVHGIERNAKMAERELDLLVGKEIEKWRSKRIDKLMDEGYKRDEAKAIAEKEAENERKRLAEIHKDDVRRDYSGLTALFGDDVSDKNDVDALETAARTYADKFEAAVGRRKTEEMWRLVNELNSFSLRKSYTSGLISKTQYDQARTMYKHYVPLRGWHDDFAGDIYQYISRGEKADTLQNVLKKAYGRTSRAGNIMGTMASMANCAIVQGNKNIAAQHLLNLALNHGGKSGLMAVSEQWYEQGADGEYRPTFPRLRENMTADEKQEAIAEYEERMKQAEAEGNGKVVRKTFGKEMPMHIAKWQEQQHSVRVLRNGKEYQVYILGNPRAAQAFNGLVTLDEKTGKIWNGWLKWMRFRAAMQTSFSPEFIVSNFERDIITAGTGTYIKFGWKAGKDFAKNLSQVMPLGGVMNGHTGGIYELIRKYDKGTLDTNDDMERMFGEFVRNGGMTGVSSITKSEEYERQMATVMKRIKRGHLDMPRRAMEGFFDGVEFLNKGIENATRFAAYMTSRNMGKSVAESVFDAKEASVNFNMKGSGAWGNLFLRRTILYVNPCLQSLRMLGTWYGASPKRFMGMFGTILAASVGTAILWASIGGGDDDNDWYKLSEWNRYNFINIRIGGGYAHWSIPQELRPLWALGQISFDWSQGRITKERALNSMLTQLNNLSPMAFFAGGLDSKDSYWKTAIKAWTPTIAADFMDAYAWNEDFLGRKVTGQTEWNSQAPEWRRASKDTPEWAVAISKKWNELTGGTQNRKSWWDSPVLNPSAVYYLLKQQVGGMGTLVTKMSKAYEQWRDPDEEVEARNIPFVSKFWVTTGDDNSKNRVINDKFWMLWNEYQQTDYQIKHDQTDVKNGDMTLEEMAADLNSLQEDGSMQRWKKMHELGSAYERIKKDRNNGVAGAEDKMQELKKRMVDMMERE